MTPGHWSLPSGTTVSCGHCTERRWFAVCRRRCRRACWPKVGAGGPQATLFRFLKGCDVEDLTKEQAREVGALAARAKHDDVIDVSVVEGALRRHHAVVTSSRGHMEKVADAAGVRLEIHSV